MYRAKHPVTFEAITFDELIGYGLSVGANNVNGMPWSFHYKGWPITHENDECYLIPTLAGTMRLTPGDMLITSTRGDIYPINGDEFAETYEIDDTHGPTIVAALGLARREGYEAAKAQAVALCKDQVAAHDEAQSFNRYTDYLERSMGATDCKDAIAAMKMEDQ